MMVRFHPSPLMKIKEYISHKKKFHSHKWEFKFDVIESGGLSIDKLFGGKAVGYYQCQKCGIWSHSSPGILIGASKFFEKEELSCDEALCKDVIE